MNIILNTHGTDGVRHDYRINIDRRRPLNYAYAQMWVRKLNILCGWHWYPIESDDSLFKKAVRKMRRQA